MGKVTADDLAACGSVVCLMFRKMYPDGLEFASLKELAKTHGWAKRALQALDKEGIYGNC